MKKFLSLVLAVIMVFGLGSIALGEDGSLDAVVAKGSFVLGLDDQFPPMGFRDENNELVGFDIDVATAVCEKLGVELVCQPVDWATKELELSSGAIDCIWNGFTITQDRLAVLDFSNPYLSNKQVICVKADADIASIADLSGKVLGYQAGSSAEDLVIADNFGSSAQYGYDTYLMALLELDNGNVDAVLGDLTLLSYQLAQEVNAGKFKILDESISDEEFGIGMRKGDTALVAAINDALAQLATEGKLAEISTKWFGADITLISK